MGEAKSLPRSVPVPIHVGTDRERVVNVEKLPLGRAAQLAMAFRGIPGRLKQFQEAEGIQSLLDQDDLPLTQVAMQVIEYLPDLLAVATDAVIDVLSVGTGIERDELEEVGLDEAAQLLEAVFAVNNLSAIQTSLKNVARSLGWGKQPTPEAPTDVAAPIRRRKTGSKT